MESISIRLPPQFLPGSDTVLPDSLSRPHHLTHPEWSLHMTVFLFLRRLWPVQLFSLPPRPLIVVRFTSPLSGFRGRQARTRFSGSGTAFGLTRSPPVAVIRVLSRSSGRPRGRDSLLWLSTGLSALSFRTWSSSRWLLHWSYRPVLYLLLLTRSRHLSPDLSWLRLHAWRLSSAF